MSRMLFRTLVLGGSVIVGLPALASASSIQLYAAPDHTYQNTTNNPCVFYGPGNCPHDPSSWLSPASPTNQDFAPLTQTYDGTVSPDTAPSTTFARFAAVTGGSFVLGLDVNQTDNNQTLVDFQINFFNSLNQNIGSYLLPGSIVVPALANGNGYADYILAAGCSGTTGAGPGSIQTCSQYTPFVMPAGTTTAQFFFSYGVPPNSTGNDGAEQVFLVPTLSPDQHQTDVATPEPASLLLLGSALTGLSAARRRKSKKS